MRSKSFTALVAALLVLVILAVQPTEAKSYTISVQTDASSYSGAQTLVASGAISPPPGPSTAVFLKILNPSGTPVVIGSASVNGSTGSYQLSFVLGGSSSWVAGTYMVNASWGDPATGIAIFKTTNFVYSPTMSTTTSTTTSSTLTTTTKTTSTQTTTSTSSSTSTTQTTTTSTTSTAPPTSSSSTSSTQTTTSSSTQGGGIPEYPFQILTVTFFTFVLVASYLLARRYAMPGSRLGRP